MTAPAVAPDEAAEPERHVRHAVLGWGLLGLLGTALVVVGAAQPASPFSSKLPGSWWFGVPSATDRVGAGQWLGVVIFYGGVLALLVAWYGLVTACRHGLVPGVRPLAGVLAAWTLPLVVGPPIMSRDVYAYAAQGALAARGGDPYVRSVAALGRSPYPSLVDPLWRHATSPYGPLFVELARAAAVGGGSHVLITVVGMRLVALMGMVLLAVAVPVIARTFGLDPGPSFALAVLNPLLLLTLVGGAHNDALMLGLLAAGIAAALRRRLALGVVLCALAAAVKAPAFLGVVYVGWALGAPTGGWRRRLGCAATASAVGAVVVSAVVASSGWGWGWVTAADPGRVVSWLDPATALGLGLAGSHLVAVSGLGAHTSAAVAAARDAALVAAGVVSVVLLARVDRLGVPAALGWALLVVVLLGPVVWPWYETWGLAFLAMTAGTLARRLVLVMSAVGCLATVPDHLDVHAGPVVVGAVVLAAWTGVLVFGLRKWGDAQVTQAAAGRARPGLPDGVAAASLPLPPMRTR